MTEKSENVSKKQRGRPRLLPPELEGLLRHELGPATRRTHQNQFYAGRAMKILLPDDPPPDEHPFRYLWDPAGQRAGTAGHHRQVILSELGRIADPETVRFLAEHICTHRLTTTRGVALIRRVRLGAAPPLAPGVVPDRLVDAIAGAINAHLARYPHDQPAVGAALREVLEIVTDH